jgi:hypothetical protein
MSISVVLDRSVGFPLSTEGREAVGTFSGSLVQVAEPRISGDRRSRSRTASSWPAGEEAATRTDKPVEGTAGIRMESLEVLVPPRRRLVVAEELPPREELRETVKEVVTRFPVSLVPVGATLRRMEVVEEADITEAVAAMSLEAVVALDTLMVQIFTPARGSMSGMDMGLYLGLLGQQLHRLLLLPVRPAHQR